MMDGEGEVFTDGPASEGSSLSPPFFLRLLFFAPLPFSSSDTGFPPGTYFFSGGFFSGGSFSGSSFSEGFFSRGFFAGGIPKFCPRKIVGRDVAKF